MIFSKRLCHNGYTDFGKKLFCTHYILKDSPFFEFSYVLWNILKEKKLIHIYDIHKYPPYEFSDTIRCDFGKEHSYTH